MYPGTWIWRKIKIPFTQVHGFEEETKFHVRTWIWRRNKIPCTGVHESKKTKSWDILKKKRVGAAWTQKKFGSKPPPLIIRKYFSFMYPGTWIWRRNKIPCTRVHGFEEKTKFHVPGYMNLKKKQWFLSKKWGWKERSIIVLRGRRAGAIFFLFFGNFFQQVKKLLNFWDAVNIKVAKFKLDHLRFYCKLDFFDRKIRKIRNWNQKWVLIGGTPCISLLTYSWYYRRDFRPVCLS